MSSWQNIRGSIPRPRYVNSTWSSLVVMAPSYFQNRCPRVAGNVYLALRSISVESVRSHSWIVTTVSQQWPDASGYHLRPPCSCAFRRHAVCNSSSPALHETVSHGTLCLQAAKRRTSFDADVAFPWFFALSDLLCLLTETCLYRSSFIFNWLDWNNYRKLSQSHICKAFVLWIWCPIVCCSSNTNAQAPCFGLFRVFQSRIF